MKKLLMIIYILLLAAVLSGCWGYSEITDLGLVVATGIDLTENNEYRVTVIAMFPTGAGGGVGQQSDKSTAWVGSAQGTNPMEAAKNLRRFSSKRLSWVQNDILIIGEAAAKQGIDAIIDFFVRNRETRLNNSIMICEGKAQDIFRIPADIESNLHSELRGIIDNTRQWSKAYVPTLREFLQEYTYAHIGAVAGRVGLEKQNMNTFSTNREKYMEFSDPQAVNTIFYMSGSAAFKGSKLAGFLNDVETRGYLWIVGKARIGTLTIASHKGQRLTTMETINSKTDIEPVIEGDEISFKIDVEVTGRLSEKDELVPLGSKEEVNELQRSFEESIAKEIEAVLNKAQKDYKTDIFGFGDTIYRKKPKIWKEIYSDWDSIFPDVKTHTTVKVTLRRMGQTQASVAPREVE